MAFITAPTFKIAAIEWRLDRPAQINASGFSGKRTVVANPWHGRWSANVELAPIVGEAGIRAVRAFFAKCKGSINTFRLYATEGDQVSNDAVTVSGTAAAGATTMALAGYEVALSAGMFVTVNGQLLQLTDDQSGANITFEPPLRAQATAGTAVVTRRPYALVYMVSSDLGWSVSRGQLYNASFSVSEALLETDGSAPETGAMPANSVAPAITGTTTQGQTLSVTNGTWSGSPTFERQWYRSNQLVYGATGTTYLLTAADVGHTITCVVTGTNANGYRQATSNNVGPVAAAAVPTISVVPAVTGTTRIGSTLSCTTGTWNNSPSAYAYQWLRNTSEVNGATSSTYVLTDADVGKTISCRVVASSTVGSGTPSTSNAVGPIVGYGIDLDFRRGIYKNGSNTYGALSAYAGYSFSRSGASNIGVVDADGTIDFFATDVPPINSKGYHSYMGMVNLLASSTFGSGTEADPAGGLAAKSIIAQENTTFTGVVATTYTMNFIGKIGTSSWCVMRVDDVLDGANSIRAWFNLSTGVVGTMTTLGTGLSFVGVSYIRPLAYGYYVVGFQFQSATATSLAQNIRPVGSDGSSTVAGSILGYWRQVLATSCIECPLIPNGAGTGGTRLELAAMLQSPGVDMIAYEVVNVAAFSGSWRAFEFNTAGSGSSNERLAMRFIGGTNVEFQPRAGGTSLPGPTNIIGVTAGRIVVGIARRNGRYLTFYRSAAGVLTIRDDATDVGAVPAITAVEIGCNADGSNEFVNGTVERFKTEQGTFTDAQIAAKCEEILL